MKRKKTEESSDLEPKLTDIQERDLKEIDTWCESYGKQFLESKEAQKLTPFERQECLAILQNFAFFCFLSNSEKPGEWTSATVKEVCAHQLPKRMIAEVDVIKAAIPVLTTFLQWAENQKIIKDTDPLQKAIQSVKKQMIENSNDFENWDKAKMVFIGAKRQGIDITNEEEMIRHVSKLSRLFKFVEKLNEENRPSPKRASEIKTTDDIVEDLEYLLSAYPEAAVKAAVARQDEMTPLLSDMVKDAISRYQHLHDDYYGHIHALFILAKFREKQMFPLAIQLASLPEDWPEVMLGDVITEDLHQVFGSVYDGNFELLKNLIEDPDAYIWSRGAALSTLLVLVKANVLEREFVINYLKTLFLHPSFIKNDLAMAFVIDTATQLYPIELYNEIKDAYQKKRVDSSYIEKEEVDSVLKMEKEQALKENFYNNPEYDLINDPVKQMKDWAFATDDEEEEEDDEQNMPLPFQREAPKVGRNDPCPCGSGLKFKKCCGK